MLLVQIEGGARIWISVHAIQTVTQTGPAGTTEVRLGGNLSYTLREEASEFVKRVREEMRHLSHH